MTEPTLVLDCRWLGISGAGRATEFVLRGLAEASPPGRWVLWGPPARTRALAWPGTEVRAIDADPRRLLGQRHALAVPPGDFTVFMHQQRPLPPRRSATFIYDTIPLHHDPSRAARRLKRLFLRSVVRTSEQILTISEHSRACILRDLGAPPERVQVVRFPFDAPFVDRVLALRASAPPVDAALFVGAFLPHKNLARLVAAFGASGYRRRGGRLVLAGGTAEQAARLVGTLDRQERAFVDVRAACSQDDIERLYATVRFVVQPSLEEGFGLPAWEALCCGLPVCVSDGGALPEVVGALAEPFPATSTAAMTAAIDACAEEAARRSPQQAAAQSKALRERGPSVREFGHQVLTAVGRHAALTP